MKIKRDSIVALESRIDIEDVVSDFVSLKRSGQNLMACCPFHGEKTPSFSVSPARGIYKCFGCGKGGDSINFVMDIESMGYVEAITYLAKKYGVELEYEEQSDDQIQEQNERDSSLIVLNYAKDFFVSQLWGTEEGKSVGLSYFKERGFTEQIIRSFDLGYSQDSWDSLVNDAIGKGYKEEVLEKAGLILKKDKPSETGRNYYDRFRGRVMFPIHNTAGKAIAFGARKLVSDPKQPKYVNSPETEVYHKSRILYGISQARQAIRKEDNCYLVEGYTDVISMHLSGVENVVASSGTSLTDDQIRLIGRYTQNVTVLYDGDAAGIKASLRGTDMILEAGLNVRSVIFPDGEDPDSYAQKLGTSAYQEFLKNESKDFLLFKMELFSQEAATDPIKKAESVKEIVASIAKIPDPIKRAVYVKESSKMLEMNESILIAELNKVQIKKRREQAKGEEAGGYENLPAELDEILAPVEDKGASIGSKIKLQERESMRLLINYGYHEVEEYKLHDYLLEELEGIEFTTPIYRDIQIFFKEGLKSGNLVDANYFIRNGSEDIKKEVIDLVSDKYVISENWEKKYQIHVPQEVDIINDLLMSNVLRLKFRLIQKMISENMAQMKEEKDLEEQSRLLKIHSELKKTEMEIAKSLGNVVNR